MEESYQQLAKLLFPDLVLGSLSSSSYFLSHKKEFEKIWNDLKGIPPEFVYARFKEMYPSLTHQVLPILVFEAKPNNKKIKTFSHYIVGYDDNEISAPIYLYKYDQSMQEQTRSPVAVASIVPALQIEQAISITFVDGSSTILLLHEPLQTIMNLVTNFFSKDTEISPLAHFIECVQLLEVHPLMCVYLHEYLIALFRQNDLYYVRKLLFAPFDSKSKKTLSAAIINCHSDILSLGFLLNAEIAFYFEESKINETEILRGDTILTCSLAFIRDKNAPHFFEMFGESIIRALSKLTTVEEALTAFLTEVKTITVPGVIRYICKLLYDEAKKRFPTGDASYYAVSGFLFLRGVGPFLLQSKEVDKKLINPIISLFNFNVAKEEVAPYIAEFKSILDEISKDTSTQYMFQRPTPDAMKESFAKLIEMFITNGKQVIQQLAKPELGQSSQFWFLRRMYEYCKETFE